jgi:AhpD family alkylhydroperoxidase
VGWSVTSVVSMTTAQDATTQHSPRINLKSLAPRVYTAMLALDAAAGEGLEAPLKELVRIRASQLNGCVYCLDMHATDARTSGDTEQRLYALVAWQQAPYFTERERAALALTESVTLISETHVQDDVYHGAAAEFSEAELAELISLIVTINAWNRIAVTSRMQPGS